MRKFLTNIFEFHTFEISRLHSGKILKQMDHTSLKKASKIIDHIYIEIKLANLAIDENDLLVFVIDKLNTKTDDESDIGEI